MRHKGDTKGHFKSRSEDVNQVLRDENYIQDIIIIQNWPEKPQPRPVWGHEHPQSFGTRCYMKIEPALGQVNEDELKKTEINASQAKFQCCP